MATTTLRTNVCGDTIQVTADWTQASDQIVGDLEGGRQVADFRHEPRRALRCAVEQYYEHCGDDIEDAAIAEAIDAAVSAAEYAET